MAQHTLDLSDLTPDSVDMTIPFVDKNGKVESRKITIVDPKTAIVLGIERISQEEEAYMKRIENKDVSAKEAVEFVRRKVFLILSQGNEEITEEEVGRIPAAALTRIMQWFNEYMAGEVFLEGSQTSKRNGTKSAKVAKGKAKKATR
jgi:hypothetical protein